MFKFDNTVIALNITWTNQPSADTELLAVTVFRPTLDLRRVTQFRLNIRVAVAGASGSDLRMQCSTDGSTFANADGSNGPELDIGTTGDKDTGWVALATTYRADSIRARIMGKQGDAVADPNFSIWVNWR